MLNLFNDLRPRVKGTIKFPEWEYVRTGIQMNLDNINKYYRSGAYGVRSDHELIKLLYGLTISVDTDLPGYYSHVDRVALTVGQQLGYTTSMSRGRVFHNVFFGGDSKEVIIIDDGRFDPVEVTKNWRDAQPIRILRHGFDLLDGFPLDGTISSKGISVFVINLPMLAVQYRAFRQWQKTYEQEVEGRNSIYHFCRAYPINNMIYDSIDQSIFNRYVRLNHGLVTSDNQYQHPFHVTSYVMRTDRLLDKVLTVIKDHSMDMASIAKTMPMIVHDTMFELMKLPDLLETRQVNWAIYLARIDMLLFLMSFGDFAKTNQTELNQIKYHLKLYLQDGTIQAALPRELFQKQKLVIERIIK